MFCLLREKTNISIKNNIILSFHVQVLYKSRKLKFTLLNNIYLNLFKDNLKLANFTELLNYIRLTRADSLLSLSDFKLFVSTNFTTRALMNFTVISTIIYNLTILNCIDNL